MLRSDKKLDDEFVGIVSPSEPFVFGVKRLPNIKPEEFWELTSEEKSLIKCESYMEKLIWFTCMLPMINDSKLIGQFYDFASMVRM